MFARSLQLASLLFVPLLLAAPAAQAQSADELLKKFAEEFVEIIPGQPPYAKGTVSIGGNGKGELQIGRAHV